MDEKFDLVIIGAGWYGLIAATTYLKLAPRSNIILIDDGKTIGGVWSHERIYPNLFAQVGHGLFEYSFYPMKKEGLSPDRYISGETIHNYLNDFARDFDLVRRIRLDTRVTKAEKLGTGWRLSVKGPQGDEALESSKLIVASGVTSEAYVPNFPRNGFDHPIIHSAEIGWKLRDIEQADLKRVVVLGAAKSAYDTVFQMLKLGKKVDWVIREDGTGPLAIMPPRLLGINTVDVMATRFLASFSPALLHSDGPFYHFLQRTAIGNKLTKWFWRAVTYAAESHAGYSKTANAAKLRPIPFGYGLLWANSGLGLASVPNFWKTFHEGDVTVHRTEIKSFTDDHVHLANGEHFPADLVVLCTGWKDGLSVFDDNLRATLGLPCSTQLDGVWAGLDKESDKEVDRRLPNLVSIPHETSKGKESAHRPWRLYRRMVSPTLAEKQDRSIFFPGQIHSVFTPLVAEMQALWGAAFLLGHISLPSITDMQREIALWNSWTKKRYLAQGQKHAYSIYDYLAYVDTLGKDLGIRTKRKGNPISEMFSTYRPRDYRGLIDEYLDSRMLSSQGSRIRGSSGFGSKRRVLGQAYSYLFTFGIVLFLSSLVFFAL